MARGVLMLGGATCDELVAAVARRGLDAVALTVPEVLERTRPAAGLAHLETVDFASPLAVLRRVKALDERYRFAAVVAVMEQALELGASIARQLRLPAPAGVAASRHKARMRRLLDEAGVANPRWAACRSAEEAAALFAALGGPMIVKPASGTGSEAVSRVDAPGQVAGAFARAAAVSHGGGVLCEEYVDGPEVSVEGCVVEGRFVPIAITDKETGDGFVEIGHRQPTGLPAAAVDEIHRAVAAAHRALGLDRAVTHSELRLGPRGPVLVETHTRMGGGFIHLLTAATTGVDLADLMVGLALGERPRPVPRPTGRGCAVGFLATGSGRVGAVELPPAGPEIVRGETWVREGDVVPPCRASRDRLGAAVATGRDAADAARAAAAWLADVWVEWAAEPPLAEAV